MDIDRTEREKALAAAKAVQFVRNGMKIGLGTGSTAAHVIEEIGKRVQQGMDIVAVPSSDQTAYQALQRGIPLTTLEELVRLDLYIDGTDEFDPQLNLIKGGGGALLREKILSYNADATIIVCDSGKQKKRLGSFRLPVEVIPMAVSSVQAQLERMGIAPRLREKEDAPYRTDENNLILDTDISGVEQLEELNRELIAIPGLVETGLFLKMTDILIMGQGEQTKLYGRSRKN